MSKTMAIRPRVSEKAYALSEAQNVYVFEVPKNSNKQTITDAVKAQFNVTVLTVNISNLKGKAKRTIRKGGRPVAGRTNAVKKAYVTLKEGDSIAIFKSAEEQEKPAKKEGKK